jgi:hypothetical protein
MTGSALRKQLSPAWILFILTGLNLFNYLDRYVLSAVLTPLQKDLGINDGQAGRLVTAFMIGVIKPTSKVYRCVGANPVAAFLPTTISRSAFGPYSSPSRLPYTRLSLNPASTKRSLSSCAE